MTQAAPQSSATAPHIRVLVVDDSRVLRELLVHLLNGDPGLHVVGTAADGEQAVAAAERLRPDVIVMDIHLPQLDGFGATRKIMETCPTRIVMVTASADHREVAASFRAVEAGALAVLAKPVGPAHPGFAAAADELVQTVKVMSEVRVVKRWPRVPGVPGRMAPPAPPRDGLRLVAVGASTGGPMALQALLSHLPRGFPVPLLIVQHISEGFTAGFAEWLAGTTGYPVRVAVHGEPMRAGMAYVAPNGLHMKVNAGVIELAYAPEEHGLRPAVSVLFRSAAAFGPAAAGVLLTGMGRDGARELKAMRDAGATTFAQDGESSVVNGMPAEAVRLGGAVHVMPPEKIAQALAQLVAKRGAAQESRSRQDFREGE